MITDLRFKNTLEGNQIEFEEIPRSENFFRKKKKSEKYFSIPITDLLF